MYIHTYLVVIVKLSGIQLPALVVCELYRKQPPEGMGVSQDEASLFLSVQKWARAPKVSALWEPPSVPSQSHLQEPF